MIMKTYLTTLFIILITNSYCQLGINPIIVNRIHSDEIPFVGTEFVSWVHAIGFGFDLYKKDFPVIFTYTKDFYYDLDNFNPITHNRAEDINERWEESFYGLNYRFKNYIGLEYFHLVREASLNLSSNNYYREYNGIILSFTHSLKWLDIEYKSKINLTGGFAAVLGTNSHSISFNYRIGNYEKTIRKLDENKFEKNHSLNINVGVRFFDASDIDVLKYEKKYGISYKPAIGIELINKKILVFF